ncbi:MAG: PQQ-dependent sugar dehydrogenase [Rudaea sp.]
MKMLRLAVLFLLLSIAGCAGAQGATSTPSMPAAGTPAAPATSIPAPASPGTVQSTELPATATSAPDAPSNTPPAPTNANSSPTAAPATVAAPVAAATATGAPAAPTRVIPPPGTINLPPGFGTSVFAEGLASPRNIVIGPDGQLYAAERGAGRIVRLPDRNRDGVADGVEVIASGFDRPSSLAFSRDGSLYVSTPTQVYKLSQPDANGVFQKRDLVIDGLPSAQDHFTRTLLFSPDWSSLFIQAGSSCNVCVESDSRRAAVLRFNPDGTGGGIYAKGLRNAVGLAFRPDTNELWATNNGSDNLGDDRPPDTIQILQQGQDYGWPRCHAGTIVDPQFGGATGCSGVAQPLVNIQAHSAALGLAFYTGSQFPKDYSGDLFVALHGSIYRSVPTGYKVVRIHLTNGQPGPVEDFATGWLSGGRAWGRPVDLVTAPDGSLLISDDSGGRIFRIFYHG